MRSNEKGKTNKVIIFHQAGLIASVRKHVLETPKDAARMLVPAALHFGQKKLLNVGLSHMLMFIVQILDESRLVVSAGLSVYFLGHAYRTVQWIFLVAIAVGTVMLRIYLLVGFALNKYFAWNTVGVAATVAASCCGAFAGIYFEIWVKHEKREQQLVEAGQEQEQGTNMGDDAGAISPSIVTGTASVLLEEDPPSLFMRILQLSFFSAITVILDRTFIEQDNDTTFFHGFTFLVWLYVLAQIVFDILVATLIKYTDNVLTTLTSSISIILSSAMSVKLFDTSLSPLVWLAAAGVLGSTYGFHATRYQPEPAESSAGASNAEDAAAAPLVVV